MTTTIRLTAVGDSTTAQDTSWLHHLTDSNIDVVQEIAQSGYTSGQVLNLAKAATIEPTDVLVVMLGINDIRLGQPRANVLANISDIQELVKAPHVLIGAVAPSNQTSYTVESTGAVINRATAQFSLNRELAEMAADRRRGWMFGDVWTEVRRMDGTWQSGTAVADGVHPTEATSIAQSGPRFSTYIRQAYEGARGVVGQ